VDSFIVSGQIGFCGSVNNSSLSFEPSHSQDVGDSRCQWRRALSS
jgi:hypothetical protein